MGGEGCEGVGGEAREGWGGGSGGGEGGDGAGRKGVDAGGEGGRRCRWGSGGRVSAISQMLCLIHTEVEMVQVGRKRMQVGRGEEDGGGETMWGEGRRCW